MKAMNAMQAPGEVRKSNGAGRGRHTAGRAPPPGDLMVTGNKFGGGVEADAAAAVDWYAATPRGAGGPAAEQSRMSTPRWR
jgi:hypothetical protein